MIEQPMALKLADYLDAMVIGSRYGLVVSDAATELRHLHELNSELLKTLMDVATIAHAGGLVGMSESDALVAIRKATLKYWNRTTSDELACSME